MAWYALGRMAPKRNRTTRKRLGPGFVTSGKALWVMLQLDEDWISYIRFTAIDGRPVIAELRVLPTMSQVGTQGDPWLAPTLENVDWPTPPDAGLTSRALRGVHLGRAVELAYEHLQKFLQRELRQPRPLPTRFTSEAVSAPRRPGRRGRDDRFYAIVAALYVKALEQGSRKPVVATAEMLSKRQRGTYEAAYVRDLLYAARQRGLLTRPPKGQAGGQLTDRAQALLQGKEHS